MPRLGSDFDDNSPAFQRWVGYPDKIESRTGTKEASDLPIGLGEQDAVLPSLAGLGSFCDGDPALKRWAIFRGKDSGHLRC
jgi:hypothetical protein